MTTRKKSKRNLFNGAAHMGISLLTLYTYVYQHKLFKDIYGPDYLEDEKLPINLLYALLILQFLLGLYAFVRSSIILYEYKQGIRNEEDDEVLL
ncbi:hypothetical protein [Paenibacillus solani]|uniref:Uncharacterized protein n=1 Tax=Paenibacillus solani TaxID=1705565 RepID=A0A0M1P172_9BACL|nr:hypothetical protein [Paenibacillus solani]KOR88253.1 hypothetical protein AM231_03255 [Paenibacillus solani]